MEFSSADINEDLSSSLPPHLPSVVMLHKLAAEEDLLKLNLQTLSKEIADNLNALITQEELTKALNRMPNNKSPRTDGCQAETFLAHTLVTIS